MNYQVLEFLACTTTLSSADLLRFCYWLRCSCFFYSAPCSAATFELSKSKEITVRQILTWWSHDPTGYHPSVGLLIENTSGRDLSRTQIRFQARFFDLQTANVQLGRAESIGNFQPNRVKIIKLHGSRPHELPLSKDYWPTIECRVMCRVGDVDDTGTLNLFLTKVEKIAMSDDEADEKLRTFQGTTVVPYSDESKKTKVKDTKPMRATAGTLENSINRPDISAVRKAELTKLLLRPKLPTLGADFYDFEQAFRRPVDTENEESGWTWARFAPSEDGPEFIVGSKGQGKVDIILALVSANSVSQESQLVTLASMLSGKTKLVGPRHSVRYLPTGRIQIGSLTAPGCKGSIIYPRSKDGGFIVQLSRLSEEIDKTLASQIRRVPMLSFYGSYANIDTSN